MKRASRNLLFLFTLQHWYITSTKKAARWTLKPIGYMIWQELCQACKVSFSAWLVWLQTFSTVSLPSITLRVKQCSGKQTMALLFCTTPVLQPCHRPTVSRCGFVVEFVVTAHLVPISPQVLNIHVSRATGVAASLQEVSVDPDNITNITSITTQYSNDVLLIWMYSSTTQSCNSKLSSVFTFCKKGINTPVGWWLVELNFTPCLLIRIILIIPCQSLSLRCISCILNSDAWKTACSFFQPLYVYSDFCLLAFYSSDVEFKCWIRPLSMHC